MNQALVDAEFSHIVRTNFSGQVIDLNGRCWRHFGWACWGWGAFQHVQFGVGGCVVLCGNIGFQGYHLQVSGGGFGWGGKAFYLGYSRSRARRGITQSLMIGGGYAGGVGYSRGYNTNGWVRHDWSVQVFAGGGLYAAGQVTWTAW